MTTTSDEIAARGIRRPQTVPRSINDIIEHKATGPWKSKSGGTLTVPIRLPYEAVMKRFLTYDSTEVKALLPFDIKGLRLYEVAGIPNDKIGGTEFHRVRQELILCLEGHVEWTCEDVWGNTITYDLTAGKGVEMPPFILHKYVCKEEGSRLTVFCNTLFDADDSRTHDTYSTGVFSELQRVIAAWTKG